MVERAIVLKWRVLHERWWMAEQLSRKAHGEVRSALRAGKLPADEQLARLDELQRRAEMWRIELDALVVDVMR